jgi:hypothetical protein
MPAADDKQFPRGIEFCTRVTAVGGEFCERGEHIELRDRAGSAAQARGFCGHARANVHEQLPFNFHDALVGGENFAFILFEFRGSEPFGVDKSLLPFVISGREMQIRFRNLNVIPKDLIQANLQ